MQSWMLVVAAILVTLTTALSGGAAEQTTAASPPQASKSDAVADVTVTARRLKLAPMVRKFVNRIAAAENDVGIARWDTPACPMVSGLPQEEGEFILKRLSEIARVARVPLASGRCYPNLFIVVTADPKKLLEGWNNSTNTRVGVFNGATWRRDPGAQFGAPQSVIERFINTPDAVRVWYYTATSGNWPPLATAVGPSDASHILLNIIYGFFRVFVIADQKQLKGLTIGQFADYVSMVGLADLRPGAHQADAPTILKLFDAAPRAAPAGMTDWDQAFLKSLYGTDQRLKTQRAVIGDDMLRQMVH